MSPGELTLPCLPKDLLQPFLCFLFLGGCARACSLALHILRAGHAAPEWGGEQMACAAHVPDADEPLLPVQLPLWELWDWVEGLG